MSFSRLKNWLLVLYLGFFGGAIGVLGKFSFRLFSPIQLIFVRLFVTVIVFGIFLAYKKRFLRSLSLIWKHRLHFAMLSLTGVFAAMVIGFAGLKATTAIHYDLLFNLSAVFIAIFSFLLFNEKFSWRDAALFVVALAGTFLIVTNGNFSSEFLKAGNIKGDFLVLIAAAGWGIYSVLGASSRRRHKELDPMLIVFGSFLFAVIIFLPYIILREPVDFGKLFLPENLTAIAAALVLSLAATALLFMLWFNFIEQSGGLLASFVALSENVGGVVLPILFLGESLTFWTALGGAMIVLPLILQEYLANR